MPESTNQEAVLIRKAGADAIAVRETCGNPEITDEIIGFHAQQAIEKWLKALMAHRGMDEVRIHDIGRLLLRRLSLRHTGKSSQECALQQHEATHPSARHMWVLQQRQR